MAVNEAHLAYLQGGSHICPARLGVNVLQLKSHEFTVSHVIIKNLSITFVLTNGHKHQ